jgi:serine/threonine protein phosphatase PrpC
MPVITFISHGLTETGLVRDRNEDAFLDRPEIGLWVVADGMGGHTRGDYASGRIVGDLATMRRPPDLEDFLDEVKKRLSIVDFELRKLAPRVGPDAVIGSTVVALLAYDDAFVTVWAGDSRLYQLRSGEFRQVTTDHSRTQELVATGILTPEAAYLHPDAPVITQAIGAGRQAVSTRAGTIRAGDRFLLCSDGLTNMVTDAEIAAELDAPPQAAAERLRDLVMARGAVDNFTILIVAAG